MNKTIRILLVAGAVFIIIAAGFGLLVTNPEVQRAVVTKILASRRPELPVKLEYIKVGFNRAEVRGLHLLQGDFGMSVERAEFEVELLPLLFRGEVNIKHAEVRGLFLDISRLPTKQARQTLGATGSKPAPSRPTVSKPIIRTENRPRRRPSFDGVYDLNRLAIPVWLDNAVLEGRVLLPGNREVRFDLSINSLGPGQTGNFAFNGNVADYSPGAPITRIDLDGSGTVKQADPSGLADVYLEFDSKAHGPSLQGTVLLHGKVEMKLNEQDESYTISLTGPEASEGQGEILFVDAGYDRAARELTGRFRVDADADQFAPFALGHSLPDFLAIGQGEFRYNLKSGVGLANGTLKLNADHFERLIPKLGAVGPIEMIAQTELRFERTTVFIDQLSLSLLDTDGSNLLRMASRQPFRLDTSETLMEFPEVWGDLLDINIDGLPLAWIEPFLDRPGLDIAGGIMQGGFKVVGSGSALNLESTQPLLLKEVRLAFGQWSSFWEMDVSLEPQLALSHNELRLDVKRLRISAGSDALLEGKAAFRVVFESGRWFPESAAGQITAYMEEFQKQPFVADFSGMSWKDLTLNTDFELKFESGVIGVRTARMSLLSGGRPVLISRILQPVDLELKNPMRGLESLSGDLLNIELKGLSLDMVKQWPLFEGPERARRLRVEGLLDGAFILSADGDSKKLDATRSFVVTRLSLAHNGKALVDSLDLTVKPTLLWSENRIAASLKGLDIKSLGRPMLNGSGQVKVHPGEEQPLAFLQGDFEVNFPGFFNQPYLRLYDNFSNGKLNLKVSLDPKQKLSAILIARFENLSLRNDSGRIPRGTVGANVTWKPDGNFTARLPLDITGTEEVTDAIIRLNGKITTESRHVEARISGNNFVLDDLQILARALRDGPALVVIQTFLGAALHQGRSDDRSRLSSKYKGIPGRTPTAESGARAAWAGFTGNAIFDLKRIQTGGGYSIENLQGELLLEPNRIILPHIKIDLGESPLVIDGEITFNRNRTLPYHFDARIDMQNFDAGKFLATANPGRPPAVEGIFNIGGQARSDGSDLPALLKQVRGQVQMESAGGFFRVLESGGERAQTAAALAGIAGIFAGERVSGLNTLNRLTTYLRKVPYDEIKIEAVRGQDLNINLTNFTVLGPEIHVSGAGTVHYRNDLPVMDQPLRIDALLAAKGQAAYLLNDLGQLTSRMDALDYYRGPAFSIRGTPANPDYSELFRVLNSSALGALGFGGRVDLEGQSPEQIEQAQPPAQPAEQPYQDPTQQIIRSIFDIIEQSQNRPPQ